MKAFLGLAFLLALISIVTFGLTLSGPVYCPSVLLYGTVAGHDQRKAALVGISVAENELNRTAELVSSKRILRDGDQVRELWTVGLSPRQMQYELTWRGSDCEPRLVSFNRKK